MNLTSLHLKEEYKHRCIPNLSKMFELVCEKIIVYKDLPDFQVEAAEKIQKHYN